MQARILIAVLSLFLSAELRAGELNVIPMPESVVFREGRFSLKGVKVYSDSNSEASDAVSCFTEHLTFVSGSKVKTVKQPQSGCVSFISDSTLSEEEYVIDITRRKATVNASSKAGFLYAIQTLSQMMPAAFYGNAQARNEDWTLQCVRIQDKPRYPYRGALLDCARHFFTVEQIHQFIDILSIYKINRFHWHLTDDHSWRLEIKKYPRLTEVGAFNCGALLEPDPKAPGEVLYDGFYTQEQAREIVQYASARGIVVVPEIDMPSHMTAALAAYPFLGCTGGPYEVIRVVGPRGKGLAKDALCPGRETTFEFIGNVIDEVTDIFPSEFIHIGGDECIKDRWYDCPDCKKRMEDEGIVSDGEYTNGQYLQVYFINRVQAYLKTKGRKIIGWDEILDGNLDNGATVMSWRGVETGLNAAKRGFDVIMAPVGYCYFDYRQSSDIANEPRAFAGTVTIGKVLSFQPSEGFDDEEAKHIIGVQANLWTDIIGVWDLVEYMLLPRIAALSEAQWSSSEDRDSAGFKKAMEFHRKMFDARGYVYAKHLWGVIGLPGHEVKSEDTTVQHIN